MLPTLVGQGRDADKFGDLVPVELSQVPALGRYGQSGHDAQAGNPAQQIVFGLPGIGNAQALAQVTVWNGNPLVQPRKVVSQTRQCRFGGRGSEAQRLLNPVFDRLVAPAHEVIQDSGSGILEWTHCGLYGLREATLHCRVNPVALAKPRVWLELKTAAGKPLATKMLAGRVSRPLCPL